jgi:TolA-binding protein
MSSRRAIWIIATTSAFTSLTASHAALVGSDYIRGETPRIEASDSQPLDLLTFKTHSRLRIAVDSGVETQWKEIPGGFELTLKGLTLSDLGAPFGAEKEFAKRYQSLSDHRLAAVELKEVSAGVVLSGKWKFPTGSLAPAEKKMEYFEYREKVPARLVLDFWPKKSPTMAEKKKQDSLRERELARQEAERMAQDREKVRQQKELARIEEEKMTRFCEQPLSEATDVFLEFSAVRDPFQLKEHLSQNLPEENYEWVSPGEDEADGAHVRLALRLHREKNHALALRTIEFFEKDFPKSRYRREMHFLKASARLALGLTAEAGRDFEEIRRNSPDSQAALNSGVYTAIQSQGNVTPLQALDHWLWLIRHHPEHPKSWVFHFMAAENLNDLRQTERAAKEYQWIVQNAPGKHYRVEGAVRLGDLYFQRRQYERALAAYFQALNRFPEETKVFPAIHLNRAESLYELGQLDRAQEAYSEFLQKFPSHSGGWRARFRLGEIFGRKADPESQARAREEFLETVNRYPSSPGAELARLRLLPCGDHAGFDARTAKDYLTRRVPEFTGSGEVLLERWNDFLSLAQVRSLISLGDHSTAIDIAIRSVEGGVPTEPKKRILAMLRTLFRKTILDHLAAGRRFEALKFHEEKMRDFPLIRSYRDDEVNPDYLLKLSGAASDLGMGGLASEILEYYRRADQGYQKGERAIASADDGSAGSSAESKQEKDKKTFGPGLDLILEKADRSWIEAKALWAKKGLEARDQLDALLASIPDESIHAYPKHLMQALIAEKTGAATEQVLSHLIRARMLMPPSESHREAEVLRLEHWLARTQAKMGNIKAALLIWDGIAGRLDPATAAEREPDQEGWLSQLSILSLPTFEESLRMKADIESRLGRWSDQAATLTRLIDWIEKSPEAFAARYRYERAQALSQSNEPAAIEKAKADLEKILAQSKDSTWVQLARESLSLGVKKSFRSVAAEPQR